MIRRTRNGFVVEFDFDSVFSFVFGGVGNFLVSWFDELVFVGLLDVVFVDDVDGDFSDAGFVGFDVEVGGLACDEGMRRTGFFFSTYLDFFFLFFC